MTEGPSVHHFFHQYFRPAHVGYSIHLWEWSSCSWGIPVPTRSCPLGVSQIISPCTLGNYVSCFSLGDFTGCYAHPREKVQKKHGESGGTIGRAGGVARRPAARDLSFKWMEAREQTVSVLNCFDFFTINYQICTHEYIWNCKYGSALLSNTFIFIVYNIGYFYDIGGGRQRIANTRK